MTKWHWLIFILLYILLLFLPILFPIFIEKQFLKIDFWQVNYSYSFIFSQITQGIIFFALANYITTNNSKTNKLDNIYCELLSYLYQEVNSFSNYRLTNSKTEENIYVLNQKNKYIFSFIENEIEKNIPNNKLSKLQKKELHTNWVKVWQELDYDNEIFGLYCIAPLLAQITKYKISIYANTIH